MLSQKLEEAVDKVDDDFPRLYNSMLREFMQGITRKSGHHYYSMLWASVAPKGSIYRRNGLYAEHRKHSEDLWEQMYVLADRHAELLGGAAVSKDARAETLYQSVQRARIEGSVKSDYDDEHIAGEEGPAELGFLPLLEWLRQKTFRVGPMLFYSDVETRREEERHMSMAFFVFALQVIAPLLIFLNRWNMPTNYVKNWNTLKSHLTIAELLCAGTTLDMVLTTLMSVLLLCVIIFMIRCYVLEQIDNCQKSGRLPTDALWMFTGIFANAWCCAFICLDVPLLFWSEETPTNIVLDSMTLLFLFRLDDLSDQLCSYIGMTDEDFQRLAAWNTALLSQCPVSIEDVVNSKAKSLEELWVFKYDAQGKLCNTQGGKCLLRLGHKVSSDERTPLASPSLRTSSSRSVKDLPTDIPIIYRTAPGKSHELPTITAQLLLGMWTCLSWLLAVAQLMIPVGWYVINKKCYHTDMPAKS